MDNMCSWDGLDDYPVQVVLDSGWLWWTLAPNRQSTATKNVLRWSTECSHLSETGPKWGRKPCQTWSGNWREKENLRCAYQIISIPLLPLSNLLPYFVALYIPCYFQITEILWILAKLNYCCPTKPRDAESQVCQSHMAIGKLWKVSKFPMVPKLHDKDGQSHFLIFSPPKRDINKDMVRSISQQMASILKLQDPGLRAIDERFFQVLNVVSQTQLLKHVETTPAEGAAHKTIRVKREWTWGVEAPCGMLILSGTAKLPYSLPHMLDRRLFARDSCLKRTRQAKVFGKAVTQLKFVAPESVAKSQFTLRMRCTHHSFVQATYWAGRSLYDKRNWSLRVSELHHPQKMLVCHWHSFQMHAEGSLTPTGFDFFSCPIWLDHCISKFGVVFSHCI